MASAGTLRPTTTGLADMLLDELPAGFRVERRVEFPGLAPMEVVVVSGPGATDG